MKRTTERVRLDLPGNHWIDGDWSTPPEPSRLAVVYVHGFRSVRTGEKAQALEAACARRGWTYAAFDFRGHGTSSGTMRELRPSQLLADLEGVSRFLLGKGVARLGLVGSSMGGWASAWFARAHPEHVPAIALIAPGFHFLTARWEKLTEEAREAWRREGILRIRNDWVDVDLGYGVVEETPLFPFATLQRELRTPTLIFHGMRDDIVPYARVLQWMEGVERAPVELRLYRTGDHRLTDRKDELAEAACAFFERHASV